MRIGFDDLLAALRADADVASLVTAKAIGQSCAPALPSVKESLDGSWAHAADASRVLVQVTGAGNDLSEVEILMRELNNTSVSIPNSCSHSRRWPMGDRLSVTLISSLPRTKWKLRRQIKVLRGTDPPLPPEPVVEPAAEPQIVQFVQPRRQ